MTGGFQPEISLLLMAGALLAATGFFVLLRRSTGADFMAGLMLMVSGVNVLLLTFSRRAADTRIGEIFSLFVIVAALCVLCIVLAVAAARPRPRKRAPDGKGEEGGGS